MLRFMDYIEDTTLAVVSIFAAIVTVMGALI